MKKDTIIIVIIIILIIILGVAIGWNSVYFDHLMNFLDSLIMLL